MAGIHWSFDARGRGVVVKEGHKPPTLMTKSYLPDESLPQAWRQQQSQQAHKMGYWTFSRYLLCYIDDIFIFTMYFQHLEVTNLCYLSHSVVSHLFLSLALQRLACVDTLMPSFHCKGSTGTASEVVHLHSCTEVSKTLLHRNSNCRNNVMKLRL